MAFVLFYALLCLALAVVITAFGLSIWWLGACLVGAVKKAVFYVRHHREVKREVAMLPDYVPTDWEDHE